MKFTTVFLSIGIFLSGLTIAQAQGFQYYVAPLQGLTGISQSANKTASPGEKYGGMINEDYADKIFIPENQRYLIQRYTEEIERAFAGAVIGPNQIVAAGKSGKYAYEPYRIAQCSPNFKVGYRDVFATSLGISRLSVYINDYGDFSQVLVPITYTARFIKLHGASLAFTKSETIYTQLVTTAEKMYMPGTKEIRKENIDAIAGAVLQDAGRAIKMLVDEAQKNFKPKQTQVTLLGRDGPYFIFSRGSEVGFQSGESAFARDQAGQEVAFNIKYATANVAVGVTDNVEKSVSEATNRLVSGARLDFEFEKPGRDDAKLTVMAVQYQKMGNEPLKSDSVLANALQSLLIDDIGFSAPFNVIKQDPDFFRLKLQIASDTVCSANMYQEMPGFADNSTVKRAPPSLYLQVNLSKSPVFKIQGVGGVTTNDIFSTAVVLSLIDGSGIVRQSALGSEQYELKRTSGKGLSLEQATEVSLKNSGSNALRSLIKSYSGHTRTIGITSVHANEASIEKPLSPAAFSRAALVRPIKVQRDGEKTLLLPVDRSGDEGTVIDAVDATSNKFAFRGRPPLRSDLLTLTGDGEHPGISVCKTGRRTNFMMNPALRSPSGFTELMPLLVGASMKNYDFYLADPIFMASVNRALSEGFFEARKFSESVSTSACLIGVELQDIKNLNCSAGFCSGNASVASGVRVYDDKAKIAESISSAGFELKGVIDRDMSEFVGLRAFEQQMKTVDSHRLKIQ